MPRLSSNLKERILRRSEQSQSSDCCWIWTGCKNNEGYGTIKVNWKMKLAHRVSYEEFIGPIPSGMLVLHRCDNPSCVNPSHLFLGTHQDNMDDKVKKGRQARGLDCLHKRKGRGE